MTRCAHGGGCSATTESQKPNKDGWVYFEFGSQVGVESGWRCPEHAAGLVAIIEEHCTPIAVDRLH